MALAAMIGALAVPATRSAKAEEFPPKPAALPEFIIGAQEDSILSDDLAQSQEVAKLIKDSGFNTLKVTMPWTYPSQAEIKNDLEKFQNAAAAARDNELLLMLNLIPGGGSGTGKAPTTISQQRRYKDTLIAYEHAFAEVAPGGHLVLEVPNEPNSKVFWREQKDNAGEWVAPKAVVGTLAKSYQGVKNEAQKLGIGITLVGGGLASSHNAVGFMQAMGSARRELSHKGPIMDAISLHPYGQLNDESPEIEHPNFTTVGIADLESFAKNVDESFNKSLPLWLSEYGAKTKVPADKLGLYTMNPNLSKNLVSEYTQGEFYSQAVQTASRDCRVGAIVLFNVIDDKDGHWTSGLWYPDDTPKSSYSRVKSALAQAESDRPAYC
jgi:hypothetical protein